MDRGMETQSDSTEKVDPSLKLTSFKATLELRAGAQNRDIALTVISV